MGVYYLRWDLTLSIRLACSLACKISQGGGGSGGGGRFVKRQTAVGKNMPPLTAALRRDAGSCGTAGAGHRYASEPEPFRAALMYLFRAETG